MMENPRPEEEKIIKDIKDLFRLKEEVLLQILRIFLSMKKKKKSIINFWSNNYIE